MNTQYIRKQAIALSLGELLTGTCKYSPQDMARWDKMEPDKEALLEFMKQISALAYGHFLNKLEINDVMQVFDFCENVGKRVGHVLSQGWTGTWGVRLSELRDIIKIIEIPDFELLPVGSIYNIYDIDVKIVSYKIQSSYLWVELKPVNPEQSGWEADFRWNELRKLQK